MPRFKAKGMLERNALADLWKHTLSQIPSTYGRLVYLASLRDPNSGSYRHHGLSAAFGREESGSALRKSHEDIFLEWLKMPLAQKNAEEGSGLGLPIVKGLVELHGGEFRLSSKIREGTEVIVIFPPERAMNALPQLDPDAPMPSEAPARRRRGAQAPPKAA